MVELTRSLRLGAAPFRLAPMERRWVAPAGLAAALAAALVLSILVGAVHIPAGRLLDIMFGGAVPDAREAAVLWRIRLPRAALAVAVGAALGVAGAAQQGLFRNPLADPALVGVSAGAALAAVAVIVLGGSLAALVPSWLGPRALLPAAAFAGGLLATWVALRLARAAAANGGGTAGLLLAGVAVNAVAGAGTGLLVTLSDDRQLRDITFWSMGSLASGGWPGAASAGACTVAALALLLPVARRLDALLLGEREAEALGVDTVRLRRRVVAGVALAVGGAVAASGVVGFVGLVVPHLVRMLLGTPRHAMVLPCAALLGASMLLLADAAARVAAAPAELPIGLVTALLGGPFFILLLIRNGLGNGREG